MDVITPRKTRNSRWDRKAVAADGAKPTVAHLTERDIEIFKCLARHQYLPADYIHAFVRADYKSLIHRLNLLSRKSNLYINRPHQQREHAEANYRKLLMSLITAARRSCAIATSASPRKKTIGTSRTS